MNLLYRISLVAFLCGGLIFAYRNHWIILRFPWHTVPQKNQQTIQAHKKMVTFWSYVQGKPTSEKIQLIWDQQNIAQTSARLINAALHLLYEENALNRKIQVQSSSLNPTGTELMLNLSHEFFQEEQPIREKWMIIEGLLRTLRTEMPTVKNVLFLVNHRPMEDAHLDFTRPWPLEGFLTEPTQQQLQRAPQKSQNLFTIMLEPSGDARRTGRLIDDTFERGVSLQCAQELKKVLESICPHTRVVLSRFAGEALEPLQNAAFANRLKTDIYITLSMYELPLSKQKADAVTEINIYYFLSNPVTDFWQKNTDTLHCEPYHRAHISNSTSSRSLAHTLYQALRNTKPLAGQVHACGGLPIKPLIGITAPAFLIELGLPSKTAWQPLTIQIAQQLRNLIINN